MDFLEGFLLGPIWSDTEYETRRHTGFYWLLGWLIAGLFSFLLIFPEQAQKWMVVSSALTIVLCMLFFAASPFLCRLYYRIHFSIKFPVLIYLVVKYLTAVYLMIFVALRRFAVDREELPAMLLDHVNDTMAKSAAFFESWGRGLGMILGIVSGGIIVGVTIIGGVLFLSILPALLLYAFQLLQRGLDLIVYQFIYHEND